MTVTPNSAFGQIRVERMLASPALVCLGSNYSADSNLPRAVTKLGCIGKIISASAVYESPPIGHCGGNYLNAVVRVDTCLSVTDIRRLLKTIETEMGRTRESKQKGAITIDLDLCMLGSQVMHAKDICVPSRDILTREYLAKGCAQVMPGAVYPGTEISLAEIARILFGTMNLVPRPDVVLLIARAINA
jgi:2-amino-4-hydroxy-6-hydroxymethyldihydropteridine diphosphokinase